MPIAHLETVDLHYLTLGAQDGQTGSAKPLVMVHGLGANLAFWYHLAPALLSVTQQIVLFDLRGHGRSSMPSQHYTPWEIAEDLKDLLDFLGIETVNLLAHSFGGSVALHFSCLYPHRVQNLMLADVRLRLLQPALKLRHFRRWSDLQPQLEKLGITLDENDPESGHQILEVLARSRIEQANHPKLMQHLQTPFSGKQGKRTAQQWLKLLEMTTAQDDFLQLEKITIEQLEKMEKPILAVYGEQSPALPTGHALQKLCSPLNFETVPAAGHFFPLSSPQPLITSVKTFLS